MKRRGRETAAERRVRARRVARALADAYPDAWCALRHDGAWQLLVATILSAQCTDERVNLVTPALFARYPTPAALAAAPAPELEELIRSTGFFRQKAKALKTVAAAIVAGGGEVPREMDALVAALTDPYKTVERQADIESALAMDALAANLKSGDPRTQALAFEQAQNWIKQYELLAPGALEQGKLVNPALQKGVDSNVQALLDYARTQVVAPYIKEFDGPLSDALEANGYLSLAAFQRGIEGQARVDLYTAIAATKAGAIARFEMQDDARKKGEGAGHGVTQGVQNTTPQSTFAAEQMAAGVRVALAFASNTAYTSGYNVGSTFARGIADSGGLVTDATRGILTPTGAAMEIRSEPKDHNSPLYGITKWGGNLVRTYADGMLGEIERIRIAARAAAAAAVIEVKREGPTSGPDPSGGASAKRGTQADPAPARSRATDWGGFVPTVKLDAGQVLDVRDRLTGGLINGITNVLADTKRIQEGQARGLEIIRERTDRIRDAAYQALSKADQQTYQIKLFQDAEHADSYSAMVSAQMAEAAHIAQIAALSNSERTDAATHTGLLSTIAQNSAEQARLQAIAQHVASERAEYVAPPPVVGVPRQSQAAFEAGQTTGTTYVAGYTSTLPQATAAFYAYAATLRGILPSSEPKDPRSPWHGITKIGSDAAMTIVEGWRSTLPAFQRVLTQWGGLPMMSAYAGLSIRTVPAMTGVAPASSPPLPIGGNTYNVQLVDKLEVRTVEDIGHGLKRLGELGKLPGSDK